MSYLDDLKRIQPHLNEQYAWYDPRRYDLGLSEAIQAYAAEDTAMTADNGSNLIGEGALTPVAPNDVRNISTPETQWSTNINGVPTVTGYGEAGLDAARASNDGSVLGSFDVKDPNANPGSGYWWDAADGWKPVDGGGGSNDGGLAAQIALARGAYENRLGDLGRVFGEARGIYDEGKGNLTKKRGEFKDIYNTGQNDILTSFEGERGNLQRSSVGNKARLRNILRATGMGGSAFTRGIGSQDKANLRNLGSLSNEKTFNERENLKGFNANQDWANSQETALDRYLQGAQGAYQSGVEKAGLVNAGDIAGINSAFDQLRSNIYNQRAALAAAGGNIGAYKANPFAPNLSDMTNSLNVSLPSFNTGGESANQAVNLAPENLSYLDLLKKRAGGSLYA